MVQVLTEQQAIQLIRQLEELGMESDKIDEVLHVIDSGAYVSSEAPLPEGSGASRLAIQIEMMNETDWRKKVALAALLISNEL